LLNGYYVPVYVSNDEGEDHAPAPATEKALRRRIMFEAKKSGLMAGTVCAFLLGPDGKVIDACRAPFSSDTKHMKELLEGTAKKTGTKKGETLIAPKPQSAPPTAKKDALTLHLTARWLPGGGSWKRLPSEDWIVLERAEWTKWLPTTEAKIGNSWELDKEVAASLLKHVYPPTENNDLSTNRIEKQTMKATVVSVKDGIVRARIDGSLKMKHWAGPMRDDNFFVDATFVGFMDFEPAKNRIMSMQVVTDKASYFRGDFGVAVRSVASLAVRPRFPSRASGE
jgi:hypothetical protein